MAGIYIASRRHFQVCRSVGNGRQARHYEFLFCFAFLASVPELYRKKCKARHDNHLNSKKCKRCGGALDIRSPGRPRWTTARLWSVGCSCDLLLWL